MGNLLFVHLSFDKDILSLHNVYIMYFSKLRCFLNNLYNVHIGDIEMSVYHLCSAISSIRLHVIILHCLASIKCWLYHIYDKPHFF